MGQTSKMKKARILIIQSENEGLVDLTAVSAAMFRATELELLHVNTGFPELAWRVMGVLMVRSVFKGPL
tara:strand:- start:398 stop:604 length:207 start_codon:yes stop_codon:yes gene_type:complete